MDDKTFSERLDLIREGSYWKRIDDNAIGVILEIRDDNSNNLIVRWTHSSFEGSRAGEYDRYEFVRKWIPIDPIHSRKIIDPNEGESKMEDNKTYLKTDKDKLEDFGTGAKREDKSGKGRYDLIPGDVMSEFEDFVWVAYFKNGTTTCSPTDVSKSAYFDDWTNVELYYDFMFNVVSLFFVPSIDREECEDDTGEISYEITWDGFRAGLYEMRKQLALHYEVGAAVHGVDNWKKGLPVYGSERGGCFLDSMRRHTDQALQGKDDEPHAVAALWNAFGAVWTLKHRPNSAMYQNASAVKAEEASAVNEIMESLITLWNPNQSEDK